LLALIAKRESELHVAKDASSPNGSTYRSGLCPVWIKVRNPASIAVRRERSEHWNR